MNAQSGSDILSSLDAEQLEAATALKGPVRIIAGPGSGKTRTVSHRIAHGIATGHFNPQKVLALTYTNRAAAELRQRLRSLGAGSVQVRTFHAAALSQLQYFWPQLTGSTAPKLLTSKRAILKEAVGQKVKLTEAQLSELSSEFEYLRYSLSDVSAYLESGRLPRFADAEKFSEWFENFQSLKKERRLIDWEDALLLCTGMLRNEPRAMSHF
ncbi:MAG: UvrD-helicase domain-containing protein, partial [Aquiluna sp.]